MKWCYCIIFFILLYCSCVQPNEGKYEGDDCILKTNETGKCVRLSQCQSAIEIVKNKQHPITCGYIKFTPIVCCPIGEQITIRLSEQKCNMIQNLTFEPTQEFSPNLFANINITDNSTISIIDEIFDISLNITSTDLNNTISTNNTREYFDFSELVITNIPETANSDIREMFNMNISELNMFPTNISMNLKFNNYEIGNITNSSGPIIVGGINALPGEYPHMAALGFINGEKILWRCGGSLISEKFVLTAAHCLSTVEFGKVQWVSLGSSIINLRSDDSLINFSQQLFKIIRRIYHPLYKRPASYHDIAIVELERSVEFNINLKPACINVNHDLNLQEQLTATGWGLTKYGGNASEFLLKVNLDVYSAEECVQIYKDMEGSRRLIRGIDEEGQMCAGSRHGQEDTCSGDSGGPLQLKISDTNGPTYVVVGVTSFGKGCGIFGTPGVYTRVSKYVSWIESIIWTDEL